jgi:hypothetical protein
LRKRDSGGFGFECVISTAWIAAELWFMTALVAWQLPRVPLIEQSFGADMQVELINDGPLTIIIDSKMRE